MRKPRTHYTEFLGLKISRDLYDALWRAADAREIDRSRLVREILEREVLHCRDGDAVEAQSVKQAA
jgi:hypothetical protein